MFFRKIITILLQVKSGPVVMHSDRVPCSGEPPWPPGTVPAATGIKNHGNTCYMNAVLQCLSHTDVIAEYFVLDHYKVHKSLNMLYNFNYIVYNYFVQVNVFNNYYCFRLICKREIK